MNNSSQSKKKSLFVSERKKKTSKFLLQSKSLSMEGFDIRPRNGSTNFLSSFNVEKKSILESQRYIEYSSNIKNIPKNLRYPGRASQDRLVFLKNLKGESPVLKVSHSVPVKKSVSVENVRGLKNRRKNDDKEKDLKSLSKEELNNLLFGNEKMEESEDGPKESNVVIEVQDYKILTVFIIYLI
jgi:hypothetical protein